MGTQTDPKHNITSILIGTGEFSFCDGAISPADSLLKGFLDFGNIVAFTPKIEVAQEEHYGSYRGVRRKDNEVITKSKVSYVLKCDEWNVENLRLLFGATDGMAFTQGVQTAQAGDAWGFSAGAGASGTQKWYDVKIAGARYRNLTALTIATLTEGTDFVVDYLLGRVRFLVSQVASRVPTITCPAITAATAASFLALLPLTGIIKTGYGRLTIYDQYATNKVVLDHVDFSCQLKMDSSAEVNGTSPTDITINVDVTTDLGTVYVRNDNNN